MIDTARHWVFDMDGTLTQPVHDFAAIRKALDIPPLDDILDHLAALPMPERTAKQAWLLEHERALAQAAQPALGAVELIHYLQQRGDYLGILTRNARELALITLEAIGVVNCFDPKCILGRDEAPPKPRPDGLLQLAHHWHVIPQQMVMVGDYFNDLACAHAAGAYRVLVNVTDNPWADITDLHLPNCHSLQQLLQSLDKDRIISPT